MSIRYINSEYQILRDKKKCVNCMICVKQCSNEAHIYDKEKGTLTCDDSKCVNCQRCVSMCPENALTIVNHPQTFHRNHNWTPQVIRDIYKQAETGGILISGMGTNKDYPIYWDHMLLNASQVTNPSIDPLREPMELNTWLGSKPGELAFEYGVMKTEMPPMLKLNVPIMFSAMSFGAISANAFEAIAIAACNLGIMCNTGEGGFIKDLRHYKENTIVQVASGRFGVDIDYLESCSAIEIKIGQGVKPGIGGHLPGEKVTGPVSETRMIPEGSDALSPAPHHDIYSIEDLRQLIYSLKEATNYDKPISVKIAAVHNVSAICSGIARAGADIIVIDGFRGGTGAAPVRIRDNVGIPVELALASVDKRLRDEGIRNRVSLVCGGSIRNSADVIKAIALGADAVYIASAALIAMGCHMCQTCYTGKCNWGIATQRPELIKRLDPKKAAVRLENLVRAWSNEMKEIMGGMGINAIESLRGNRLMLRGIGLSDRELEILGIKAAGE